MQTSPLGQLAFTPSVFVQAVVPPVPMGWQLWHGLLGFRALGETKAPAIQQPEVQLAGLPLQTSPVGQLAFAPSVLVQTDVLIPGWQLWQGLLGFTAPEV